MKAGSSRYLSARASIAANTSERVGGVELLVARFALLQPELRVKLIEAAATQSTRKTMRGPANLRCTTGLATTRGKPPPRSAHQNQDCCSTPCAPAPNGRRSAHNPSHTP